MVRRASWLIAAAAVAVTVLGGLSSPAQAADPLMLNPSFDSGDHLHPNDAGYQAMANAVNLALLT
jgi:lysophospholipase L1-like esterase